MWLFTKHGFFSAVCARQGDGKHGAIKRLHILRSRSLPEDSTVSGFKVRMNCGEDAGQTVMPAHLDLIPRRRCDTKSRGGGVKGVIPDRIGY